MNISFKKKSFRQKAQTNYLRLFSHERIKFWLKLENKPTQPFVGNCLQLEVQSSLSEQ